jgi:ubiquinone/menaquinone biosynthesis C-methylase UbiE
VRAGTEIDSPLAVIRLAVVPLRGARILDVGCGDGGLARLLVAEGAEVVGVDPNSDAISIAKGRVPEANFDKAPAEALPFKDNAFDAVILVNALHHVPLDVMDKALVEAARVLQQDGSLIVIEPLAAGSFFEALRIVEDETAVRLAAHQALMRAIANGILKLVHTLSYVRQETFDDVSKFLDGVLDLKSC